MMKGAYNKKLTPILEKYGLKEMPEAHNYLKINVKVEDFTTRRSKPEDFMDDLVEEQEITAEQITDFKVQYHKGFIAKYLLNNPQISYSADEFWMIREECIEALQK